MPCTTTGWWQRDFNDGRSVPVTPRVKSEGTTGPAPFWGLMAFTCVLLLAPQTYFPVLTSLRLALVTAAVAITTYFLDRFVNRQPMLRLTGEMWIAVCLGTWAVATVPLSYWPGGSVDFLLSLYFKTLIIFLFLPHVVTTVERLQTVSWSLSLMAVPLAVVAVKNYFSGVFIGGVTSTRIMGYEAPLTENPNDLALMLNLILPLTLALLFIDRRPRARVTLLGIAGLEIIAVILTFSRSGFLTLATVFFAFLWKFRGRQGRSWSVFICLALLFVLPFAADGYLDRVATITDIDSDPTGSAQARWRDMVAAGSFFLHHPIVGSGVGTNVLALNEVQGPFWQEVHNAYLQYAVELGLPGLMLFLLLLFGCIKAAGTATRSAEPDWSELSYLATGIQISLIAFAVGAMFSPVGYHFHFYYFAGLALAVRSISQTEGARA